jgi:hypothetical protein
MHGEGTDSVVIPLSRRYTLLFVVIALLVDPFAFFGMLALSTTGSVGTLFAVVGSGLVAVVTLQLVGDSGFGDEPQTLSHDLGVGRCAARRRSLR